MYGVNIVFYIPLWLGLLCDTLELLSCRMSLKCSALYLSRYRFTSPNLLASGDGTKSATIIGDVYIHPSAKIHPTAKVLLLNAHQMKHSICCIFPFREGCLVLFMVILDELTFPLYIGTDWSQCLNFCKCSCWSRCKAHKLYYS